MVTRINNSVTGEQGSRIILSFSSLAWCVDGSDNTAMTSATTFIGIDGCRAGWFCVILNTGDNGSCCVASDARAVGELAAVADSVLIDIPIGLPDAGPEGRLCDRVARQLLGRGRASSVFSAPASSERDGQGLPMEIVYCTPGLNP